MSPHDPNAPELADHQIRTHRPAFAAELAADGEPAPAAERSPAEPSANEPSANETSVVETPAVESPAEPARRAADVPADMPVMDPATVAQRVAAAASPSGAAQRRGRCVIMPAGPNTDIQTFAWLPDPPAGQPADAIQAVDPGVAAALRAVGIGPPPAPYFIPDRAEFDSWPPDLQQAVVDVINPTYDELVLRAPSGLARLTGLSILQLAWLEIIEHIKLARLGHGCELPDPDDPSGLVQFAERLQRQQGESRAQIIERTLRLAQVKLKASNLLTRLNEFRSWRPSRPARPDLLPPWGAGSPEALSS